MNVTLAPRGNVTDVTGASRAHELPIDHPAVLWNAGLGLCGICGRPVDAPPADGNYGSMPTMDHVFPKSPKAMDLARIAALRRLVHDSRRKVVAHRKCNNRKSNRPPTGCEVVFLMAVNARLRGRPQEISAPSRTKARADRRKRKRARERLMAEMLARSALQAP